MKLNVYTDKTDGQTYAVRDRITQAQKDSNNYQWYRDKIQLHDVTTFTNLKTVGMSHYAKMKANYDLFNDIIDTDDFLYITKPYGEDSDMELPADFKNRDIMSGKIKAIIGIEMKRPLSHKIIAVNEDATNRRTEELFGRLRQAVVAAIMKPIEIQIRTQVAEQTKGQKLTPDEQQQIEQQVQQELQTQTPEEVHEYMKREHKDPAEALMEQLFDYVMRNENIVDKFNKGFLHGTISAFEVYLVDIVNNEPYLKVVNPLYFNCDKSPDTDYIEDGEWATCEYRMTPSEIISLFGDELTNDDIDEIYKLNNDIATSNMSNALYDGLMDDFLTINHEIRAIKNVRVFHATWKSLKKIGFLTYQEDGVENQTIVDENYRKQPGDVELRWEWIPEVHEGYKIGRDIYKKMRPVAGQYKDINKLYEAKLPYYGAVYDSINSAPVSLLSRMKPWQYYYNIIMYRIERLMASDKGKIALLNMNMIPKTAGIDLEKWLYYADTLKIGLLNPNEEKKPGYNNDISNSAKEIDLGHASEIQQYVTLAEYVESKCGKCVGITPELEGQINQNALVGNSQQNISMASNIIEPYFNMHDRIKKNVMTALLEISKIAYSSPEGVKKIAYVLDDMSVQMLEIDEMLLDASSFGIFIGNSSEGWETKQYLQQLFQAALQNNKAELSDLVRIMRSTSMQHTEEILKVAEDRQSAQMQKEQAAQAQQQQQLLDQQEKYKQADHERQIELIRIKEQERRETELQKQAMMSVGFDTNKDEDGDGEPDVLELYKHGVDADIKARKQTLEEAKFKHQKEYDSKKLAIDEAKAKKVGSKK